MTTNTPVAPTSVADAIEQGVALANANGAPPLPAADEDADNGGTTDDTTSTDSTTGTDGADAAAGEQAGDKPTDAGDGTGAEGDSAAAAADKVGADGTGGDDDAAGDADADPNAAASGTKEGKPLVPAAKKPDPINDPIPNALKRETKERIRTLATMAKEGKARADTSTAERDELISAVTDTGASPEQYAGMLDYLTLVNSNDQNKLRTAANFMIRELSALSRIGGFRIPGITSYAGHADLEKAVSEGKLVPELAEEIAANRAAAAHQGKVGAAQQQASEARQRYNEADQAARAEMNTLETAYRKVDPLYKEKQPLILSMLSALVHGDRKEGIPPLHPVKWPAAYKRIYETLPASLGGMKVARQPQPGGKVPQNQPLRTQQPAGAQKQEPKSVAEAIEMGVEMARGG